MFQCVQLFWALNGLCVRLHICLYVVLQIRSGHPTPWVCLSVTAAQASIETLLRSARWNLSCWIPGAPLRWRWGPPVCCVRKVSKDFIHTNPEQCRKPCVLVKDQPSIYSLELCLKKCLQPLASPSPSPPCSAVSITLCLPLRPCNPAWKNKTSHPSQFSTAWKAWASSWQIQPILCVYVRWILGLSRPWNSLIKQVDFTENIKNKDNEKKNVLCIVFIHLVPSD